MSDELPLEYVDCSCGKNRRMRRRVLTDAEQAGSGKSPRFLFVIAQHADKWLYRARLRYKPVVDAVFTLGEAPQRRCRMALRALPCIAEQFNQRLDAACIVDGLLIPSLSASE